MASNQEAEARHRRGGRGVTALNRDGFAERVQNLRESWIERRQVKGLSTSHEFEPQFQLLLTLHGWAEQGVRDIRKVYGDELDVTLSPVPEVADPFPAFSVMMAQRHAVTFSLAARTRTAGAQWHISVLVSSSGPGGSVEAAGPERRNGHWTRGRVEEVLLSALGAYERAAATAERAGA